MGTSTEWIGTWIRLEPDAREMAVVVADVPSEEGIRTARVTAVWQGESREAAECLLHMPVADDRIRLMWKPHLAPEGNMVIGDLLFRSPAIVLRDGQRQFALYPDLDWLKDNREEPHVMDFVETDRNLFYGLCRYEKKEHVYHRKSGRPLQVRTGQTLFSFYLVEWEQVEENRRYSAVSDWIWRRFAEPRMKREGGGISSLPDLSRYVDHAYDWAFRRWESVVWQQFRIGEREVGGPVFIVRAAQAPGHGEENLWRERKSLWNQAWFCGLRSAYGYRLWGERRNDPDWIRRAELNKEFALAAPMRNGLFPSVFTAGDTQEWTDGAWGHSDRRPQGHDEYAHLLDMSWTCYWMLRWYEDIEQDERLAEYAAAYADRLVELQNEDGSFPAWVHTETGHVSPWLRDSAETALHVWFLLRLNRLRPNADAQRAAKAGIGFLRDHILPERRWEDFETYWSCARAWERKQPGVKDARSGLFNQSTFSMYWTAEAFREWHEFSRDPEALKTGEDVLAELSLYQAVWNPPYLGIPALGGYGVLNSDDEWNDARQSLAALTHMAYYRLTGKEEHLYRGLWAMRASFYMMYCPENPEVKALYERKHPHFGPRDYGFEMENFHHGGSMVGEVGEFTIFDWGNGSAAASLAELLFVSS
ncbi:hypothetical protein [Cohnella candidum]|uniref:Uncharacterized protein n=1 Tax=Cohnella candidum TaxID=2674991 RepID=A0A3G3JYZ5_9BACL|nr:hypothetical protein [Cohnella candidum]AYQ73470.1 hypothetical protein EAV92_13320 [Cohnella candidum]